MALYDDYMTKLNDSSSYGGTYKVQADLERSLAGANVDADLSTAKLQKSSEASNARSAFAAGKASGQKKVFKGRSSGAYGAIGRLDNANVAAAGKAKKDAAELKLISPQAQAERAAAIAQANASAVHSTQNMFKMFGSANTVTPVATIFG